MSSYSQFSPENPKALRMGDDEERPPTFNGGKTQHIFVINKENGLYTECFFSFGAEAALKNGIAFYKIDGSNGMLIKSTGDGGFTAYQRLDTRGRPMPEHCINLPVGLNNDAHEGHSYFYEPITLDVQGKKARKRNQMMLDVVERNTARLDAIGDVISVEWVGAKFQKTPGVPHDVAIAVHSQQVCEEMFPRTFEGAKEFLLNADQPCEGLIFALNGLYWKLRSDCFDRNCRFKKDPSQARAPVFMN